MVIDWLREVSSELGTVYCVFSTVVALVLSGTADDEVPLSTDDALLFAEAVALVVDCLWFSLFSLLTNADVAEMVAADDDDDESLPLFKSFCAAFGLRMEKWLATEAGAPAEVSVALRVSRARLKLE